jgi:hypothetical protein
MSNRLGGKQGTAYLGTNANQPPNVVFSPRNPTQYDVNNVTIGDMWVNSTLQSAWILVSLAANPTFGGSLAVWHQLDGSGTANITFDADIGTAFPIGDIVNVIGGDGIEVTGDDLNTLTISSTGIFFTYINVNTTPYVVLDTDVYLSIDTSVSPIEIQLPDSALLGEPFFIKDRTGNADVNNITLTTVSGIIDIDAAPTFVMDSSYQSVSIVGNGTNYEIY